MNEIQLLRLGFEGPEGEPIVLRRFPAVVGRQLDCDVRLANPLVSRRHCAILLRDGRVWVEDLGSRNGTRLNRVNLGEPCPLDDGDQLDVGPLSFSVRLSGAGEEAAPKPALPAAAGEAAPRQVLVVEDDEGTAFSLAGLLESWGHHVRVAHDGPSAVQAAQEDRPEVVFLDINLPGMSGVEVARRLRADPGLRNARLVAVTGNEGATEVLTSRGQFEQLLVKPVSARILREAVAKG